MPVRLPETAAQSYSFPLLIRHLLRAPLASAPDQQIVYRGCWRYTYRALSERVGRLANLLTELGLQPGETAAVMDWDSHRYLECYFAIPMMGAVMLTVNVRLAEEQILYTLNHAGARVLLINSDFLPLLAKLRDRLVGLRAVVVLTDEAGATPGAGPSAGATPDAGVGVGEYEALLAAFPPAHAFEDFNEDAIATSFYTTGTTGLPKAVSFSHRQLVLHTLTVQGALASAPTGQSLRQGDVYMPLTPMFHVHAWGLPYVATVLGLKQVYPGRYSATDVLALRQREGVTFSHCVPTILQMLLDAPTAESADLHGWKFAIGGSALPAALAQRATGRGMQVFAAYGMSETCPVVTIARSPDLLKAGMPLPLVDVRVVDENMDDVAPGGGALGEVVLRAPWLTAAYRGDREASERLWRGGYLHTQDIGFLDERGQLQIRDRLKDVIKTGGEWVSSLELEDLICRCPEVAEAAVIGVPDASWGERPLALVVPKGGDSAGLQPIRVIQHLQALARAGLITRYAIPERVEIVARLDRTSVGKLDKKLMRARFARATGAG